LPDFFTLSCSRLLQLAHLQLYRLSYSTADEAEACFGAIPHTVDGTQIEIKRSTPKGEKSASGPKGEVLRKIFIGGLTYSTTDEGLKTYFEQFGEVVDCVVMKYKDSDRSRGFGTFPMTKMFDNLFIGSLFS